VWLGAQTRIRSLAIGALYSRIYHPGTSGSPSKVFARRAKLLVESSRNHSSLAYIQTLLLLSSYEAAQGSSPQGELTIRFNALSCC
jgi:hypothetical protein